MSKDDNKTSKDSTRCVLILIKRCNRHSKRQVITI